MFISMSGGSFVFTLIIEMARMVTMAVKEISMIRNFIFKLKFIYKKNPVPINRNRDDSRD